MSQYKYSDEEKKINSVLAFQEKRLSDIQDYSTKQMDSCIADSENLLNELGYNNEIQTLQSQKINQSKKKVMVVPSWERLCREAENNVGTECELEALFTEEELRSNEQAVKKLNEEYNTLHKFDKFDYGICAIAGMIAGAVDILMVGIPKATKAGLKAAPLSDYIRNRFAEEFPIDEMEKLADSSISKVPYDAQDNRNTIQYVSGLSSYYHRLLSLGHDPLLGFVVGVFDILTGRMTTIDKKGKLVSQVMENYADRKESDIFAAIAKQLIHFKSDIMTSCGLPVPLMGLFNLLQFGSIGDEEQTIAEIVQGMYYEGYDFVHFCSMSIPAMLVEVVVRIAYAFKRIKEGNSVKESIPVSLKREKHPKLATMLFVAHSAATAINAGKVYFTGNPMAINYPQWIAFARYSYMQLKWLLIEKPSAREAYVLENINEELKELYENMNLMFDKFSKNYTVVFEEA